jgi:hypothetical protein
MFVPEPVRRDLMVSAALYLGMFLGELTAAVVKRRPAPVPVPVEVPDVSVVPE